MKLEIKICILIATLFTANPSWADSAAFHFPVEGRLTEKNGKPVDGPIAMAVRFFHKADGGEPVLTLTEHLEAVTLQEGVFLLDLTLSAPDYALVFPATSQPVYVEVVDLTHNANKPYPRFELGMSPYAGKIPVDSRVLYFDDLGQLTLAPNSAPSPGQFLTKDSSGNLIWATPAPAATLAGASVSSSAPGAGQILKFSAGAWTPANDTSINRSGDDNIGSLSLGSQKTLGLGTASNTEEASLIAALTTSDRGKTWFNTSTNQVRYWDGAQALALGASGSGLANFNGQVGNTQTLAMGSTGTAPAWSSAANTHTLNIPMAASTGVTAGLLSKADYDAFDAKLDAAGGSMSGDLNLNGYDVIAGNLVLGSGAGTSTPTVGTLKGPLAVGTNLTGGDIKFDAATGTGNGGSGGFIFRTAPPGGTSGTTSNTLASSMKLSNLGYLGIGTSSPNSRLDVAGPISTSFVSKTSSYTLTANDSVVVADAAGGAITLTLPTATAIAGRRYTIKKVDGSANAVTLDGSGAETIDGASSLDLSSNKDSVSVISNGSNWIVDGKTTAVLAAPTISGGSIAGVAGVGVRDSSAAYDVTIAAASSTNLTAGRTLTVDIDNANRTLSLKKNLAVEAGNVTLLGQSGGSSVTLPSSGTLSTLAGTETFSNKTLQSPVITGGSLSAITGLGLRDSSAAFDINFAATSSTALTASRTLTLDLDNSSRTFSLKKNLTVDTGNITLTGQSGGSSVTLPSSGTLTTLVGTETLSNKTLGSSNTITGATAASFTNGAATITLPSSTSTLASLAGTETLTNKTLDSSNTITGATAASFTNGAATVTLPTSTSTLASLTGTEAFTNKTLGSTNTITGATAASFTNGAATITLPSSTGTLATLAGTETFTNKTFTSPTISGSLALDGQAARSVSQARMATSNTAGSDFTLQAGGATSGATDKAGGSLYLVSGISTGTGASSILLQTAAGQSSSGTTDNTPATRMTIAGTGNVGIGASSPTAPLEVSGKTLNSDSDATVGAVKLSYSLTKNDANTRTFPGLLIQPTINTGASNTTTTSNVLAIDTTNTAVTGVTTNLINASYGGSQKFLLDSSGNVTVAGTLNSSGTLRLNGGNHWLSIVNGDGVYIDNGTYIQGGRVEVGSSGVFAFSANATYAGAYDTAIRRNSAGVLEIDNGTNGQWGGLLAGTRDAGTTTVANGVTIGHQSSGTPAAGLGSGLLFNINSSSTADRNAGQVAALWTDATDASRTSALTFSVVNAAASLSEAVRISGAGNMGVGTTSPTSKLQVNGAIATVVASKTAAYTLATSDSTISADATSAAFTVTLPTAVDAAGRIYTIKKVDSSGNAVIIGTTSAQTIDGSSTYSLATQWKYVNVQSDGANWLVVGNN